MPKRNPIHNVIDLLLADRTLADACAEVARLSEGDAAKLRGDVEVVVRAGYEVIKSIAQGRSGGVAGAVARGGAGGGGSVVPIEPSRAFLTRSRAQYEPDLPGSVTQPAPDVWVRAEIERRQREVRAEIERRQREVLVRAGLVPDRPEIRRYLISRGLDPVDPLTLRCSVDVDPPGVR